MHKHPVAYPAVVLKDAELAPASTFAFFPQPRADRGLLCKYLTLTFTVKFSSERDVRCRGKDGERCTRLGRAASTSERAWGPCSRGQGQRGSSRGLLQTPFWATSGALVKASTCHTPSLCPEGAKSAEQSPPVALVTSEGEDAPRRDEGEDEGLLAGWERAASSCPYLGDWGHNPKSHNPKAAYTYGFDGKRAMNVLMKARRTYSNCPKPAA